MAAVLVVAGGGCVGEAAGHGRVERVWGGRGLAKGQFQKPRAMAIDDRDQLYIVDFTGRIQVFSREGEFLRSWRTPEVANGKPTGLSFDRQGRLMVADTHYFRILFYEPDGRLLKSRAIGGEPGHGPGQFNFVTAAVEDSQGNYYVAEYGEYDRIQKLTHDGQFVLQWGGHGREPGQFVRPQSMIVDEHDRLWVADACNHRIQVFDLAVEPPRLVSLWGEHGSEPGQLSYPYDLAFDGEGNLVVCEFGNHRVQWFTPEGESLGCWGTSGVERGQLANPWAVVVDSQGGVHVLDTYNHRVQRVAL